MTSTKHARIRHLAIGRPRHSPNISPPQPTPALRHLKATHGCLLLHLRQPAYQPKGLRFRLDERSVAGHPLCDKERIPQSVLSKFCGKLRTPMQDACYVPITEDAGNIVYENELQ